MTTFLASRKYWSDVIERAIKTAAQIAAATLTANATGLLDADWSAVASVAGLGALLSVLTSVGSGYVGDDSAHLGTLE